MERKTEKELVDHYKAICPEFFDVFLPLEFGRGKYGGDGGNWLEPNAKKTGHNSAHDSMFHHLSDSRTAPGLGDWESNLDPLLHLACRALMTYTRQKRGIKHETE